MKKLQLRHIPRLFFAAMLAMLVSCQQEHVSFNPELLVGKWVAGTEYYRYDAGGTGVTWDTSDDVNEDEAQPFTWEYEDETNRLTLVHQMEMGGVVPKSYTVTALTDSTLSYKDIYGHTYTYTHVN